MATAPPFPSVDMMKTMSSKKLPERASMIRSLAVKKIHMLAARVKHAPPESRRVELSVSEFNDGLEEMFVRDVIEDMNLLVKTLAPGYLLLHPKNGVSKFYAFLEW